MTIAMCQHTAVALFIVFTVFGVIETARSPKQIALRYTLAGGPSTAGSRWSLFGIFQFVQAVLLYGIITGPSPPRPAADVRAGAVSLLAAMCVCAYIQAMMFGASRDPRRTFPRHKFWFARGFFGLVTCAAELTKSILP